MDESSLIYILLSSYNGEKYIGEQVNSLFKQSYTNWKLLIRDDGSSDNTINIIKKFEKKDKRISLIKISGGNLGSCQSFLQILAYTKKHFKPEYIMFCDQDDVWLKDKIKNSIEFMQAKEKLAPEMPILVHTDLIVADKNLKIINKSLWAGTGLNPHEYQLRLLVHKNVVTGCTVILNKKLIDKIYLKQKQEAIYHDWLLALIASALGKIYRIYKPDILYRQHGSNDSGGYTPFKSLITRILKTNFKKKKEMQARRYMQASSFLKIYNKYLSKKDKNIFEQYISLQKSNIFKRAWIVITYRFGFSKKSISSALRLIIYR